MTMGDARGQSRARQLTQPVLSRAELLGLQVAFLPLGTTNFPARQRSGWFPQVLLISTPSITYTRVRVLRGMALPAQPGCKG